MEVDNVNNVNRGWLGNIRGVMRSMVDNLRRASNREDYYPNWFIRIKIKVEYEMDWEMIGFIIVRRVWRAMAGKNVIIEEIGYPSMENINMNIVVLGIPETEAHYEREGES